MTPISDCDQKASLSTVDINVSLFQDSVAVPLVGEDVRQREKHVPVRIFVDGPIKVNEQANRCAELSEQLDATTLSSTMPIQAITKWSYGLDPIPRVIVPICRDTCRPYIGWRIEAERVYGMPPEKQLSLTRAFADFVVKYGRFPSRGDLMVYVYNRELVKQGEPCVLPAAFSQFVDEVIEDYACVVDLGATEFVKRLASKPIYRASGLKISESDHTEPIWQKKACAVM